jgi:sugar lactone lactonase YvrE
MSRTSVRAKAAACAVATLTLLSTTSAVAADHGQGGNRAARTTTYALPGSDVFPEGVDTFGQYFYVTSTTDGAVFRGRIGSDDVAKVFLQGGQDGRTFGVGIEATDDLLLVAGGGTGSLFVYDRRNGAFLGRHTVARASSSPFLNDIAVTSNGDVFVTDSAADVVYRIAADDITSNSALEVFADFAGSDPTGEFNANGIVATPDGRYLIVVQSDTGRLLRVSTRDGSIRPIDLGGATVTTGDGLELQGSTLYVVRNVGVITEVRLKQRFTRGRVVSETTDPSFQLPTTVALDRGRLLVVNSQFDQRGLDPVEPFTVSSIKRP